MSEEDNIKRLIRNYGVILTLSVFGISGGRQLLCDKEIRVEIGIAKQSHLKFILVKSDETVIQLPFSRNVDIAKFANFSSSRRGITMLALVFIHCKEIIA